MKINDILPGLSDGLQINNCNIDELVIYGSFDFSYYHNLEIILSGPSYISLPIILYTEDLKVRIGNEEERNKLVVNSDIIENDDKLFVFENKTIQYYIFAKNIKIKEGTVYYYKKKNLKTGEEIAGWVK